MASMGDVTVELDLDIDPFRRNMRRMRTEMDGISQSTRGLSGITSMFKQGLGIGVAMSAVNGLVAGFRKLGSVVKGSISEGIEYNASLEQNTIAFEVMLGSMEEAEAMMSKIQSFADVTPFSTEGLVQSAKVMKQFGIVTEKIMPNLEMLGDIALGDSEKLSRLTLAFSQIQSTGRLMGQDLLLVA